MPDTDIAGDTPTIAITDRAAKRIAELAKMEGKAGLMLRVQVSGGGCSGFQYGFSLDEKKNDDDRLFAHNGVQVVVDEVSLDLVKGAELDFVEELVGSYFRMKNPNATSTCGCGTSFAV
jgi:iron-sulfur cluster insertion protein